MLRILHYVCVLCSGNSFCNQLVCGSTWGHKQETYNLRTEFIKLPKLRRINKNDPFVWIPAISPTLSKLVQRISRWRFRICRPCSRLYLSLFYSTSATCLNRLQWVIFAEIVQIVFISWSITISINALWVD